VPEKIKGHFVSVWDEGTVKTNCELNPKTGELSPEIVDVPDLGALIREYFETPNEGDEIKVCPTCHEFIMKTVMNPRGRHDLVEEEVCSNPDCESRTEE
jgi:hypothetical protein